MAGASKRPNQSLAWNKELAFRVVATGLKSTEPYSDKPSEPCSDLGPDPSNLAHE